MLPTPDRRLFFARLVAAITALVLLLATAGCGSASPQPLDAADAGALEGMLANVRASAQRGDRAAALAGLAALRARVGRLAATGALPSPEVRALRTGIDRALAAAQRELEPPRAQPAVVATAPPPVPAAPPRPEHGRRKRGHGPRGDGPGLGPGPAEGAAEGPRGGGADRGLNGEGGGKGD